MEEWCERHMMEINPVRLMKVDPDRAIYTSR